MRTASIDIETNLDHDCIWLGWVHYWDTKETVEFRTSDELLDALKGVDTIAHWHGIGFELPVLLRVWELDLSEMNQIDGLLLSRLHNPSRATGHSLASYGQQLGYSKGDFTDFNGPGEVPIRIDDEGNYARVEGLTRTETRTEWLDRMSIYCERDAVLNTKACKHLIDKLKQEKFHEDSWQLEHDVQPILVKQMENGFKLDIPYANKLYRVLGKLQSRIEKRLQSVFPPIVHKRVSEKTGKQLKDKTEVFNVGSRLQIAKRLETLGATFPRLPIPPSHAKRGVTVGAAKVDETILEGIELPEAKMVADYLTLQKRTSMINSWLEVVQPDGRVHGKITGNKCVTGRMAHSKPNLGQVVAVDHAYGVQMRSCWIVEEGNVLVGIDASGLELRMLAHYMKNISYIREVVDGDVHTKNMEALGHDDRYEAKTWIYAWLYGAGLEKLGTILGCSTRESGKKRNQFLANTPALKALKDLISEIATKSKSVPGLDGRRIRVRHHYAALNSLLQGAGAIVMKKALVIFQELMDEANIDVKFVANVHDEWQLECPPYIAHAVGTLGVQALVKAGEYYELRCPLDGEYKIGNNWAETH